MEKCLLTTVIVIWILNISSTQSVKGETFYILISPDHPCPVPGTNESQSAHDAMNRASEKGQQCFTLQEFVTNLDNFSDIDNFSLALQPGEHCLDSLLSVHTIRSFAMISEAATINCASPHAGFELSTLEKVTINGISFMGCRDIEMFYVSQVIRFENSSLLIRDQGSLMLNSVHNVTIIGSSFLGNGNEKEALHITNGSSVYVQFCTFSQLTTRAIYNANSSITIDSCAFENNSLIHRGNGALIENMNYKESVRIMNCEFVHNDIGNATSGSIFIDSHGSVKILSNRFVQNSGKVVDVRSFNQITIDQNSFMDNTGPGAALNINAKAGPLIIKRNHFTNNADGAVNLLVSGSVAVTVSNCSFSSNTKLESGTGGAAITLFQVNDDYDHRYQSTGTSLQISQSGFNNNSALGFNSSGGAIHIRVAFPMTDVSINSNNFSNNCAKYAAGAVYIENHVNSTITVKLATFDNNTATEGHAGAVSIEGVTVPSLFILSSVFINNTAPHSYAGALHLGAADTSIMMGSTFLSNSAQYCGALGLNSKHINMLESNFISNSAVIDGGAICTYPGVSDITISTGSFSYNHAKRDGGVLVTQPLQNRVYTNKTILSLAIDSSSYFDHNRAGSRGGVFAVFIQSKLEIASTSFVNNRAGIEGGVMFVKGAYSSMNILQESQLGFNSATERGGVISINNSRVYIGDTRIFNNSADMGAVVSACNSFVTFYPSDLLSRVKNPDFPNCAFYVAAKDRPSSLVTTQHHTVPVVTTVTIPPTRAKNSSHPDIGIAIGVPIVCLLGLVLFAVAILVIVCWRRRLKCKKSARIGRYGVKRSGDPDFAPLMDNA